MYLFEISTIVTSSLTASSSLATGSLSVFSGTAPSLTATTFVLTEVGDAQTQGDYAKCSVSGYEKIN